VKLSDISIRRPVSAAVVAMLIAVVGLVGFFSLAVREYPAIDPPVVSVETTYVGAAASVIESRVTQVLEEQLSGLEGLQTISSRSRDGQSSITLEFTPGRSVDEAANDVRDRVGAAARSLPTEVDPPTIRKVDADATPILFLVFSRPGWSRLELSDYVDRNIADRFANIPGVARVFIAGEARPAMRIGLRPERLAAFGMTPADVEQGLRNQNVELPAGRLESNTQNVTLRVDRPFANAGDFTQLVVARGENGYQVRLGDVARIEQGPENPYTAFRLNGEPALGLAIIRQSGANTLAVAQAAKAAAAAIDLPEEMSFAIGLDESLFIGAAIDKVYQTLAEAAILVILVIYLFLGNWRATLIPAVTVPLCLLASFAVLWALGFSINLLTLLALVLSIGIVVDDAIVVLENVYHRIEEGEPPLAAAFNGSRQVAFAIVSTTFVVCAVFVPVMFISGETGLLFRELAAAMIGAVAFSGFLALTLAPMLCSKLLKFQERGRFAAFIDARFRRLEGWYSRRLDGVLRRPLVPGLVVLALLLGSGFLFTRIQSELAPAEDVGIVQAQVSAPEGTGFAEMDRYMSEAQARLMPLIEEGSVRSIITRVPGGFGPSDDFNNGSFSLFMPPWGEREQTTADLVREVNRAIGQVPAVRGNAQVRSSLGGGRGRGQPVQFVIAGATYGELAAARDRILAAARQNPGLVNVDSDYKESKPQLRIEVDTARAGDLGVSVAAVSQALQTMLGSRRASTYVDRGEEYQVVVQAEASARSTEANLASIHVRSRTGDLIPLSNLVTTRDAAGARDLGRYNKMRAITLSAGLAEGYSLGEALTFMEAQAAASPQVTAIGYRGQSQSFREAGGSIWIVFGLTILVVYLLLAAQFESFVHPAVIITTVPLAVAGGLIGLAVMSQTMNLYSQIGIIMLVGLAAKNGILIVEFANQLRDQGRDVATAIREASARRLRPILMTSIATVAGAVPLMIAHGAGAGARSAIGVVIVFGVSISTLITLFLIPLLYSRLARYTGSPMAVTRKLEAQLARGAEPQPAE